MAPRRLAANIIQSLPTLDPYPLVFAAVSMLGVSLLAAYVPARRASRWIRSRRFGRSKNGRGKPPAVIPRPNELVTVNLRSGTNGDTSRLMRVRPAS